MTDPKARSDYIYMVVFAQDHDTDMIPHLALRTRRESCV
jgi:hypothetical protein